MFLVCVLGTLVDRRVKREGVIWFITLIAFGWRGQDEGKLNAFIPLAFLLTEGAPPLVDFAATGRIQVYDGTLADGVCLCANVPQAPALVIFQPAAP